MVVRSVEYIFHISVYRGNFDTAWHCCGMIKMLLRGKLLRFHGESGMMKVQIDLQEKHCRTKYEEKGQRIA